MNLIESILSNGDLIKQISGQFGLDNNKAQDALSSLLPALSRGLQNNAQNTVGLDSLLKALQKGSHNSYIDDPSQLAQPAVVDDGNNILSHIFGNKDVSRNVASYASGQNGLDSGILKKLLPVVASVAMGMLSKQSSAGGGGGTNLNTLTSFLDSNKDGSVLDDILRMIK